MNSDEHQEDVRTPSDEHQEEEGMNSDEHQEEAGINSDEHQEDVGTPSDEHQEEVGTPQRYQGELGSPEDDQKEELGLPKGQHEEGMALSGGHQEEAGSPLGEPQEELGSPKGEDNGQQEEEKAVVGWHQEETESHSGECQEELWSPEGEHKREVGPQNGQQKESEHQKEVRPPDGPEKKVGSPADNQDEVGPDLGKEGSLGVGQQKADSPDERWEKARSPGEEWEKAGSPGEDQAGAGFPGGQQEDTASPFSEERDTGFSQAELQELKKVSFALEPEMINESMASEAGPQASLRKQSMSEVELTSQEEMNTSEMIDQMFKGVLDITVEEEEGEKEEDGNWNSNGEELGEEKKEQGDEKMNTKDENEPLDTSLEELLTIPPSCILSPLSKSLAAVVTPMTLAPSPQLDPPPVLLTPEEVASPPVDSPPLYSIDAYRNQRQLSQRPAQSVAPAVSRRAIDRSRPQPPVNTKEKITLLNEEAAKLQGVISQTLQALSCCTDEGHGRGSLEEVEAEKLLLVSYEKRSALLAEVSRLREGNMGQAGVCDPDLGSLSVEPCRGTVTISNVQLPLKVEFICPARARTGQPTHYFFVLIRYGACNIVATPLATAADARNGDTISFPTSITLQDIRANFQIDVEVYSLSRSTGNNLNMERRSTKYKVTPKKLLNTISRFNHSLTSATLPSMNPRRSSNFSLVGSHKITLASLGRSKFPLDKVPFLSPLEGNIYLRMECEGHSHIQHRGFLTMFEDVNGFGAWHRHWFCLEESRLSYWNYPNDEHIRTAEGSISLASCSSHCVRPVTRDSCARPNTFELVNTRTLQQNQHQGLDKRWFSADTREEREEWMEKLNQSLLDLRTWKPRPVTSDPQPCGPSRESIL